MDTINLDLQPDVEEWPWDRTIHVIAEAHAVLTVDTAVANIAAVLGIPTILIPQTMPEFRWGRYETVPWAPSVQIVRRRKREDWPHALARAVALLP